MARIRSLKPEFFRSERLSYVSRDARLTFAGLWVHADDEGRYRYSPKLLKADVFPYDDDVSGADVDKWVQELAGVGVVCHYEVAGAAYLHVVNFHEHQKPQHPTPSKLPECPKSVHGVLSESSMSPHEDSRALTPVVVDGDGVGEGLNPIVEQARPLSVIPGGFSDDPADILDVWDTWKASTGRQRCDFSPVRRQAIVKALDKYPMQDVLDAVQGHVYDPWPERPQHTDITQLLHMGTKRKPHNTLEKMRDLWRNGPPQQISKTTAKAMRTSADVHRWAEEVNGERTRVGGPGGRDQRGLPAPASRSADGG